MAASVAERVAFLVSSTVGLMPWPAASFAMSLASNSQAASGPSQPPYAAPLTPFRPMFKDRAFALPLLLLEVLAIVVLLVGQMPTARGSRVASSLPRPGEARAACIGALFLPPRPKPGRW